MEILIINGPNLGHLGKRCPDIYGRRSWPEVMEALRREFPQAALRDFQSNSEGEIIDAIEEASERAAESRTAAGIVINPGAYTHYSYAIADAIEGTSLPVVEVHISNIFAREDFRARSVTARCAAAVISGMGTDGYAAAVRYLLSLAEKL